MAKPNKTAHKSTGSDTDFKPSEIDNDIPEGFVLLGSDRLMYKPAECGSVDLRGVLLDATSHKAKKAGDPDYWILHLYTTAPTLGVDNEEVVDVPAGKDIMIVATEKLKDLVAFTKDEVKVPEVIIQTLGQIQTSGGNDMWTYRRMISRTPWTRGAVEALRLKNAMEGNAMNALSQGAPSNVPMRKPETVNAGG